MREIEKVHRAISSTRLYFPWNVAERTSLFTRTPSSSGTMKLHYIRQRTCRCSIVQACSIYVYRDAKGMLGQDGTMGQSVTTLCEADETFFGTKTRLINPNYSWLNFCWNIFIEMLNFSFFSMTNCLSVSHIAPTFLIHVLSCYAALLV